MLKKFIFIGLIFSLHVPIGAMEPVDNEQIVLFDGGSRLSPATFQYLEALARVPANVIISWYDAALHPVDNLVIPIHSFLNDAAVLNACVEMGIHPSWRKVDPSECLPALNRMVERRENVQKFVQHFVEASGPERVEILSTLGASSVVPGAVFRVAKMVSNKYKFGIVTNPDRFPNLKPEDLNSRPSMAYEEFRNLRGATTHKWAITQDGRLHISHPFHEGPLEIKHADLTGGADALAAGMAKAWNGKFKKGDLVSGHFKTYGDDLKIVVPKVFERHGFGEFRLKIKPIKGLTAPLTHAVKMPLPKIEPNPLAALVAAHGVMPQSTEQAAVVAQARANAEPRHQRGEAKALELLARAKNIQKEREQVRIEAGNKARVLIEARMKALDCVTNQASDRFWDSDEYIRAINIAEEVAQKALDQVAAFGNQKMKTAADFDALASAYEEAQGAVRELVAGYTRLLDSDTVVANDCGKIVEYARENAAAFASMQGKFQEVAKWQKHAQDFQLKEAVVKKFIAATELKKVHVESVLAQQAQKMQLAQGIVRALTQYEATTQRYEQAYKAVEQRVEKLNAAVIVIQLASDAATKAAKHANNLGSQIHSTVDQASAEAQARLHAQALKQALASAYDDAMAAQKILAQDYAQLAIHVQAQADVLKNITDEMQELIPWANQLSKGHQQYALECQKEQDRFNQQADKAEQERIRAEEYAAWQGEAAQEALEIARRIEEERQAQVEVIRQEYIDAVLNDGALCDWFNSKKKQKPEDWQALEAGRARYRAAEQAWAATPEGAADLAGSNNALKQAQAEYLAKKEAAAAHAAEVQAQKREEGRRLLQEQMDADRRRWSQEGYERNKERERQNAEYIEEFRSRSMAQSNANSQAILEGQIAASRESMARQIAQGNKDSASRWANIRAGEEARRAANEAAHRQTMNHYAEQSKKQAQEQAARRSAQVAQAREASRSSSRGAGSSFSGGSGGSRNGTGLDTQPRAYCQAENSDCPPGKGNSCKDGKILCIHIYGGSRGDGSSSDGGNSNGGGSE